MNKAQIVDLLTQTLTENGTKKSPKALAAALLEAFCHSAAQALAAGDEVVLPGLGRIKVVDRAARVSRNPQNGEPINVPACKKAKLKPAKGLLEMLNA